MLLQAIEEAIAYARAHLGLGELDAIYKRNLLLHYLGEDAPYLGEVDLEKAELAELPDGVVDDLMEGYKAERGGDDGEAERFAVYVLGLLSPSPENVNAHCHDLLGQGKPDEALDYLYRLSIGNYYIAKSKVDRNIVFPYSFKEGSPLEISINLSKPEKNNKDIAKLLTKKASGYPKCLLCKENLGYAGTPTHPARENIRYLALDFPSGRWYLQYSPYVYYHKHCILFNDAHSPMRMDRGILATLLDFVDAFPCFFMGSNSDLPIVGGSILDHEHFQGGGHMLPLLQSGFSKEFKTGLSHTKLWQVDFYDSCLCLQGKDKQEILDAGERILLAWRGYDDPENGIISHDGAGQHSTITPIARKVGDDYRLYIILRNNRCDEAYPDGIFHVHPERFHIKREGIGLIEAAGLFILPARLKRQIGELVDGIKAGKPLQAIVEDDPGLAGEGFAEMYGKLKSGMDEKEYLASTCRDILGDVAVYKHDSKGQQGLDKFIGGIGL